MDKILKGVLRYNITGRSKLVADIQRLGETLKPNTVLVTCMDARVLPTRFADSEAGQMFVVRNAGNMVPDYTKCQGEDNMLETVGAGLELGVKLNNIQNLVVCGHSDCKAVNLMYDLRKDCDYKKFKNESPLKTWVAFHGHNSVKVLSQAVPNEPEDADVDINGPLVCSFTIGNKNVTAKIDPENQFGIHDRLSQIHCLQQASNFSTYPTMEDRMAQGRLKVHAMWFDIHKGDVYLFSPRLQRFAVINSSSVDQMMDEISS